MTAPTRTACPDSELLGAFAEGLLDAAERARIIEHLDGCPYCASEVATLAALVGDGGAAARRPAWWWLAAAAFFLVIGGAWFVVQRGRVDHETRPLVAAADGLRYRPVEARLTGGFRWAAYRGAVRSDTQTRAPERLKVAGAAGEMLQQAETDRSPGAQHAAGIASLLIEDPTASIDRLTKLTAAQPNDARAWNDLAAAHLDAADRFARASELPLALASLDSALRIEPRMPEALFNHALIVERIGLLDEARRAWEQYLAVDPSSDWAREARTHLNALPHPSKPPASATTRPAMETEVLGRWGESTLHGAPAEADRQLALARAAGIRLHQRGGEALLGDAVAAIDAASPADRLQLAEAHIAYRAGRLALAKRDASAARRELLRAEVLFSGRSGAGQLLAQLYLASADYVAGRVEDAERELVALRSSRSVRNDYVAFRAQLAWQYGLTQARLARWPAALDEYRAARAGFTALGEDAEAAFLDALIAEGASFLGRRDEAWEGWCRALRVLSLNDFDDRFAVTLGTAARTEWIAGRGDVARSLLDVEIRHGAASGAVRADALLSRVILSARMGDAASASAMLAEAMNAVASIPNRDARAAMTADLQAAKGIAEAKSDPPRALAALTQAIGDFGQTRRLLLPAALYERGRVLESMGRAEEATGDLRAAVAAVEQQRGAIEWRDIRSGALDGAGEIYAALAALLLRHNETAAAFAVADRAASRDFYGVPATEPLLAGTLQRRLLPGELLVEYLPLPDRLVAFAIDAQRIVARDVAATPATLALRAGALDAAMRYRAGDGVIRNASAGLEELLIAPLDDQIRGASRVTFVAPPPLASVPFAALFDARSGRWLIEDHVVCVAASAMRVARPARMPANGVVIIHPMSGRNALPSAAAETASLLRTYPGATLVEGNAATPATVLHSIEAARVIHFAGHADSERDAGLVLSSADGHDELLYAADVARMRLGAAPLVILAGCGTLRGAGGGDLLSASLARAFLLAGARAVVGTSWDVHDDAAAELFARLHRALAASGDPVAALREAQLAMLHRPSCDIADWAAAQIVIASAAGNPEGGTP